MMLTAPMLLVLLVDPKNESYSMNTLNILKLLKGRKQTDGQTDSSVGSEMGSCFCLRIWNLKNQHMGTLEILFQSKIINQFTILTGGARGTASSFSLITSNVLLKQLSLKCSEHTYFCLWRGFIFSLPSISIHFCSLIWLRGILEKSVSRTKILIINRYFFLILNFPSLSWHENRMKSQILQYFTIFFRYQLLKLERLIQKPSN